jgi:hypothetical protein
MFYGISKYFSKGQLFAGPVQVRDSALRSAVCDQTRGGVSGQNLATSGLLEILP